MVDVLSSREWTALELSNMHLWTSFFHTSYNGLSKLMLLNYMARWHCHSNKQKWQHLKGIRIINKGSFENSECQWIHFSKTYNVSVHHKTLPSKNSFLGAQLAKLACAKTNEMLAVDCKAFWIHFSLVFSDLKLRYINQIRPYTNGLQDRILGKSRNI